MTRRVVVTGMGSVTPLGNTLESCWQNLLAGKSGVDLISAFDASEFATKIAGEVKDFDFKGWIHREPALSSAFRSSFFALQAAEEAFKQAGLKMFDMDRSRFGIYFGAGDSGIDFDSFVQTVESSFSQNGEIVDKGLYLKNAGNIMHGLKELESQPFMTVTHLARYFDIRGPVSNCLTACAASSQALGEAYEAIKLGRADVIMSGGSHSMVYPLGIAGFSCLTALSTKNENPHKASRPFDKKRDGFVLSEGAAVLILEDYEHATQRGARILGEIIGYGSTSDAYRLTDMEPEGKSAARAVEIALQKGGLSPQDIDYISAHGTSTNVNDLSETREIKKVFGDRAYKIPVSSVKSMLGHMIAAAGALEAIVCFLAMRDSIVPPTINYEEEDPDCDLDYVPNQARKLDVQFATSNSFGFGGQNICLALKKYE